jgi:hypothetical protein
VQINFSECPVDQICAMKEKCLRLNENFFLIVDKNSFRYKTDLDNPQLKDIRNSEEYVRVADVIIYVTPHNGLRVMKNKKRTRTLKIK